MTDDTSAPGSAFDSASWLARDREFIRLRASVLPENKAALFQALANARVGTVEVLFNGYGDSGQIEQTTVEGEDDNVDLQLIKIEFARVERGNPVVVRGTLSAKDAIEKLVYVLLEQNHAGWEINEGAYGDFVFDVAEQTITLNYNERIETSEYTQHVF